MLRLAIVLLLLSFNSFAGSSWQEEVKSLLPPPLSTFVSGTTTLKDVTKALGKAQLVNGSKHYWEQGGLKYALEITFKANKISSINYTFTGKRPELKILLDKIKLEEFTPHPTSGKSAGRFLKLQENGAELILDPLSKTIYSVRLP